MKKMIICLFLSICYSGIMIGQFTINEGVLTAYTGTDADVIIPSEVIEIADEVFMGNITIVTVTGANVEKIGTSAFEGAIALQSASFPALISLGTGRNFYGCTGLETVELGNLSYAGGNGSSDAFTGCPVKNATLHTTTIWAYYGTKLTPLLNAENIIFTALETIGNSAFKGRSNLKTINLGNTVTSIGNDTFSDCSNLQQVSRAGTTTIGNNTFKNCTKLTQIDLAGVTALGSEAFTRCTSLTLAELPASLTFCGGSAFAGCALLTDITVNAGNTVYKSVDGVLYTIDGTILNSFPAGRTGSFSAPAEVKTVAAGAFHTALITSVTLPNTEMLNDHAFAYCKNLTEFVAPKLKTIKLHAFRRDPNANPQIIPQITGMALPALTTLEANALTGLTNLRTLDLSNAENLTTVHADALPNISGLTVTVASEAIKALFPAGKYYTVVVKISTGISETENTEYSLFRNVGIISINGLSGDTPVSIISLDGKTIYQNTVRGSLDIDIAGYPKGIYIVKAGKTTSKIVL